MPDPVYYFYSPTRSQKYATAAMDAQVNEHCVSCKRILTRYEFAMGLCVTCMNQGKTSGVIVTKEEQERAWNERLRETGIPSGYFHCTKEMWKGTWPFGKQVWRGLPWCVYIWGQTGTGKTHTATAMLIDWMSEEKIAPKWYDMLDLISRLRPGSEEGLTDDAVIKAKVLLIDDMKLADASGESSLTQWGKERLIHILMMRYNANAPTIITSNRDLQTVAMMLSDGAASRIAEGLVKELTGDDYRILRPKDKAQWSSGS